MWAASNQVEYKYLQYEEETEFSLAPSCLKTTMRTYLEVRGLQVQRYL